MLKIIQFFLQKIGIKFDAHKLKKIIDLGFIITEKIVVKLDKILPFYLDFYKTMIENEIKIAGITKKDKILHIGCGSIPATPILVAEKTGACVTGIDKNLVSIKKAQELIYNLKLSSKIKVEHAEASRYPLDKFDLIIASQGIKPYNETLRYIAESMSSNARVILRTSSSNSGELVEKDLFLKDIFKFSKKVLQEKNGLLISVLLLKK